MTISIGTVTILLLLLMVATVTDFYWQTIYNWNTYLGILLGFVCRGICDGEAGLADSAKGFLICGFLMLICFMLFNLGGGDLKLIAMVGAFLGFERGVEAMLWTLILGSIFGVSMSIWNHGFTNLVIQMGRQLFRVWKARAWVPLETEMKKPLKETYFLAPAALVAVLIVAFDPWGMNR